MRWTAFSLRLLSVIGDDGTGPLWRHLSPAGREVLRLARLEARTGGQPCLAGEHILLGVLRHGTNPAAALLHARGLDLATTRAALARIGPTLPARVDPAAALGSLGIDPGHLQRQLERTFGPATVHAAQRRVRRRSRWRGGHPRPRPVCGYLLARHSFHLAIEFARRRGETAIGPGHLLYGVLRVATGPASSRLTRRQRAALGVPTSRPDLVRLLLLARGLDPGRLAADLAATALP